MCVCVDGWCRAVQCSVCRVGQYSVEKYCGCSLVCIAWCSIGLCGVVLCSVAWCSIRWCYGVLSSVEWRSIGLCD